MMKFGSKSDGIPAKAHEHYFELCALAPSGTLTDREWAELKAHLADCGECGRLLQEYREIGRTGMALLMPAESPDSAPNPEESWSPDAAKQELLARLARGDEYIHDSWPAAPLDSKRLSLWQRLAQPRYQVREYAAGLALLAVSIGSAYVIGTRKAPKPVTATVLPASDRELNSLRERFGRLQQERDAGNDEIQAESAELNAMAAKLRHQTAEVDKWKDLQSKTAEELAVKTSTMADQQSQYVSVSNERDAINRKLQSSEATLETVQKGLDDLRAHQSADVARSESLEKRLEDLSARLRESEATVQQQREYLAADRDIRDLIGARDLYMADVYDVDQKGETRKPFGHVFYTKNKSLIFYAYDLDQQPEVRKASIFQAWGRHGMADKSPLNMGLFYLDSENKKRWILKFDDPEALAQIDAVFVTVEPRGGSPKPSGKHLLFASLRNEPNHR